ncbi:MAG: choice-of-anchor tandem repeat GloVer-containing protein [Verrucomicrobiota bacterium]|jgi:uncharacterized repeat protein (TIGR03803 family)
MHGLASAQTATFTTLVNFNGTNGALPYGALLQARDGNFYGTTYGTAMPGGTNSDGTVFRMTPGGNLTTLASFAGTNGAGPTAGLALGPDGNLYGTTSAGGTNGAGTVFQITTNGHLWVIHSFRATTGNTNADGASPQTGLTVGSDGLLYGTAYSGGSGGNGTIFKITTNGTLTVLHSFNPGAYNAIYAYTNADGANPYATLAPDDSGGFYGTTLTGGTNGYGTVFHIATNGTFALLSVFNYANGSNPQSGLALGTDGNLYGAASGGCTNGSGTVFQMTTNRTIHTFHCFSATVSNDNGTEATNWDGAEPQSGLIAGPGGVFYGATTKGGINGNGTVFQVTTNGVLTPLYSFTAEVFNGSDAYTNADGLTVQGALTLGSDGNLYGVANTGGNTGNGTVFQLALAPVISLPGQLSIRLITGNVVLQWTNASSSLQTAGAIAGTYTNVPGAINPYTNPIVNVRQFFRLMEN